MHKQPCTYILASAKNGTLYIGVTSNLIQRIWQHKNHQVKGFTEKYAVNAAITREKQIKKWNRAWKVNLIEKHNPDWRDLW